jgi:predicted SAM-dependent methyltransferase
MRIDIGCGNRQPAIDCIGIDIIKPQWADTYPNRFLQADIRERLPFKDNQFDVVSAKHVIEHFGRQERFSVLAEWCRILRVGGELKIVVPNVKRYAQLFLDGQWDCERFSDMMFGAATTDFQHHYCCYDEKSLQLLCHKASGGRLKTNTITYGHIGQFKIPDLEMRGSFIKWKL